MKKISYKEFTDFIREKVQETVSETVRIENIEKGNGKILTGLCFCSDEDRCISPIIYLESYYTEYLYGISLDELVRNIVVIFKEAKTKISPKIDELFNYENVRDKVALRLMNTEKNKRLLLDVPHRSIKDLSIAFHLLLEETDETTATMLIRNGHIKQWGINTETLWHDALKNQVSPARLYNMTDKLRMLTGDKRMIKNLLETEFKAEAQDTMYILTNSQNHYGASSLIYPGVLEKIKQIVKRDFFILPSSIHELIIIPQEDVDLDISEINQMISNINLEQVALEDILSDHCYLYSDGKITIP